ncbi:UNKNOWN [Stylonychia lemnae]|uniref:Protein sleepless n=1 Tax=Stylonychia lemnae TaxID=5949 RepID=A0A078APX5_STYLE|nr:UNKNOWN [Stylonychia lemnae]|eukprot:CDW84380.1 UNKNOWN [Stylonychia lemnae]
MKSNIVLILILALLVTYSKQDTYECNVCTNKENQSDCDSDPTKGCVACYKFFGSAGIDQVDEKQADPKLQQSLNETEIIQETPSQSQSTEVRFLAEVGVDKSQKKLKAVKKTQVYVQKTCLYSESNFRSGLPKYGCFKDNNNGNLGISCVCTGNLCNQSKLQNSFSYSIIFATGFIISFLSY